MNKRTLTWAAILGCSAVILGAMGAHMLKSLLSESSLNSFKTGVEYQIYHAIALLAIANYGKKFKRTAVLWISGALVFSCSIYLLALKEVMGLPFLKFLGPITPIGGILMILGWVWLFVDRKK